MTTKHQVGENDEEAQVSTTSMDISPKKKRKRRANGEASLALEAPLLPPCAVCGTKASGHHFGAVTCEACKVFFLRKMDCADKLRCHKDKNCSIFVVASARRFTCTYCRLQKCLSVGMCREGIKKGRYRLERRTHLIQEAKLKQQEAEAKGLLPSNIIQSPSREGCSLPGTSMKKASPSDTLVPLSPPDHSAAISLPSEMPRPDVHTSTVLSSSSVEVPETKFSASKMSSSSGKPEPKYHATTMMSSSEMHDSKFHATALSSKVEMTQVTTMTSTAEIAESKVNSTNQQHKFRNVMMALLQETPPHRIPKIAISSSPEMSHPNVILPESSCAVNTSAVSGHVQNSFEPHRISVFHPVTTAYTTPGTQTGQSLASNTSPEVKCVEPMNTDTSKMQSYPAPHITSIPNSSSSLESFTGYATPEQGSPVLPSAGSCGEVNTYGFSEPDRVTNLGEWEIQDQLPLTPESPKGDMLYDEAVRYLTELHYKYIIDIGDLANTLAGNRKHNEDNILQWAISSQVGQGKVHTPGVQSGVEPQIPYMDQESKVLLTKLLEVINYSAHKLVQFAKELQDFKVICIEDQTKLLKANSVLWTLMSWLPCINPHDEYHTLNFGNGMCLGINGLMKMSGTEFLKSWLSCTNLILSLELYPEELGVLKALILFSTDTIDTELEDKKQVQKMYNKYSEMLQNLLCYTRPSQPNFLQQIIKGLMEFRTHSEFHNTARCDMESFPKVSPSAHNMSAGWLGPMYS